LNIEDVSPRRAAVDHQRIASIGFRVTPRPRM
jgi:hypothetical protein